MDDLVTVRGEESGFGVSASVRGYQVASQPAGQVRSGYRERRGGKEI
jgi:hypothetical protein